MTARRLHSQARRPWRPLRIILIALAALAAAMTLLGFALKGAPGRALVLAGLDGREIAGSARIELIGLSGDVTRRFTLESLTLADEERTYLHIERLSIAWRPRALLTGRIAVESISADTLMVDREITRLQGDAGGGGGAPPAMSIETLRVDRLDIRGAPPAFVGGQLDARLDMRGGGIDLAADYQVENGARARTQARIENNTVRADIEAEWRWDGAPAVLAGRLEGDPETGAGAARVSRGGVDLGTADLVWGPQGASAEARIEPALLTAFEIPPPWSSEGASLIARLDGWPGALQADLSIGPSRLQAEGRIAEYSFTGAFEARDVPAGPVAFTRLEGRVTANADRTGEAFITLEGSDLQLPDTLDPNLAALLERAEAQIQVSQSSLTLSDGRVQTRAGEIALSGALNADSVNLVAEAPRLLTAELLPALERIEGLRVALAGPSLDALALEAQAAAIHAPALIERCGEPARVEAAGRFTATGLEIEQALASTQICAINGSGTWDGAALSFTADAATTGNLGAGPATALAPIAGRAEGAFASGRLDVRAELRGAGASVGGVTSGPVRLRADLAGPLGGLAGDIALETTIAGDAAELQSRLSAQGERIAVRNIDARWRSWRIEGALAADGADITSQLDLTGAGAAQGALVLESADGVIDLNTELSGLSLGDYQLAQAGLEARGGPERVEWRYALSAAGPAAVMLTGAGEARSVEEAFEATTQFTAMIGEQSWTGTGEVETGPDGVVATLNTSPGEGAVQLAWTRTPTGEQTLSGDVTSAPVSALAQRPLPGSIDARLRLERAQGAAWAGPVMIAATAPSVSGEDYRLVLDGGLSARGLDTTLDLTGPETDGRGAVFMGPRALEDGWVLDAELELNAALASLAEAVGADREQAEGRLDLDLSARGPLTAPGLSGTVRLSEAAIRAPAVGVSLDDIEAGLTVDTGGRTALTASLSDGAGGALRLSGESGPNGAQARLTADYEQFRLLDTRDLTAQLSGSMTWTRGEDGWLIGGATRIDSLILRPPEAQGHGFAEISYIDPEAEAPDEAPLAGRLSAIRLQHAITADRSIQVAGGIFRSVWSADVQLERNLHQPLVRGSATLDSGEVRLLGRPLVLTEGRILFNGDPRDARLSVAGGRTVDGITASVDVAGTVSEPRFSLSSSPDLPEDEILARLVFGRALGALSPLEIAQLAALLGEASGAPGFNPLASVADGAALDAMALRIGDRGQAVLALSRQFGRNLSVEVEAGGAFTSSRIEWSLTPDLSVLSRIDGDGDSLSALIWGFDFGMEAPDGAEP